MTGFMKFLEKGALEQFEAGLAFQFFPRKSGPPSGWIPGNEGVSGPNHERNPGDSELAASRRDTRSIDEGLSQRLWFQFARICGSRLPQMSQAFKGSLVDFHQQGIVFLRGIFGFVLPARF